MNKLLLIISVSLLTIGVVACGSNSTPNQPDKNNSSNQPVENDSEVFTDDKKEIEAYVIEAKKSYSELMTLRERYEELRSVSAAKEMDDHEFGAFLHDEIIPANRRIAEEIAALPRPNQQTIEINQLLIDAVGNQNSAFTYLISAIETGDSPHDTSASTLLDEASKSEKEFVKRIEQVVTDYNIE